ncbi:MAG: hypothetical protein JNL32_06840 [Candidatus Kapabacteria bacterium]|nr:hypothetical protein [Candidatus Kapabacteria bacterium]
MTNEELYARLKQDITHPSIIKILAAEVASKMDIPANPTTGQVLIWNGTAWVPTTLNAGGMTYIIKPTDESVQSSTTLQDDDHLQFTMVANKLYNIDVCIVSACGVGAGGMSADFSAPSGTTVDTTFTGAALKQIRVSASGNQNMQLYAGSGNPVYRTYNARFAFRCGSTGGLFKFRWTQDSSDSQATVVRAGSFLAYQQLD